MIRTLLFIHFSLMALAGFGQSVKLIFVEGQKVAEWDFYDTLELQSKVDLHIRKLWVEGYLFAGVDSVNRTSIHLHRGAKIKVFNLEGEPISLPGLIRLGSDQIEEVINLGYPFAKLVWDSLRLENGRLDYQLTIINGPFITNDSIVLLTPIRTKSDFIARTLGIEKGTFFKEKDLAAVPDRIARVPFLILKKPTDISFQNGKAWTYLDLEEKSTGSFEGVLGVLPNQSGSGKSLLTGNLNLFLLNLFRSGKEFDFKWNRFGEESQKLDLRYKHPFVAGSRVHLEGQFGLIKQDSSFIGQNAGLKASFFISDQLDLGFAFGQSNGDIIATNAAIIIDNNWLDFQQNSYFVSLSSTRRRVNLVGNHQNFAMKMGIGERIISLNPNVPTERYDTLDLRTTNFEMKTNLEIQRMLTRRAAIYVNLSTAHQSNAQLITNQLFRLGGLMTLRGFNEESFFASSFVVTKAEWRVYFEQESYLFAFYDQGFLKNHDWQSPIGLGGGFSLRTNSGLFSFALAVGKTKDIPLEFANMKVHFGYLSRF